MVFPRMRARVAGVLFVLWLGFLAFLAFANRGRVVVARPQLERSNLVVLATLADDDSRPAARIRIQKVLYAEKPEWQQLGGETAELKELAFFSANQGWQGAGDYVVPLTRRADMADEVTLLPLSPGYYPATFEVPVVVGDDPNRLASNLSGITDTPAGRLRELFNAPNVTLWHVSIRTKEDLEKLDFAVSQAGGRMARERRRLAEARIYRATPDVLEQVNAIRR